MNIAAIEAGGTKFVVGIVTDKAEVIERVSFPTTTPSETMELVIDYLKTKEFEAIGLGCFGPIDPNKKSVTYGYITKTPKVKWQYYNIVGELAKHFECPIGFDTDVNGAALGELYHGAAKGLNSCLYITVGTGIGAGAVVEGNMINGLLHPEMGHISVRRHPNDSYEGTCPFHGDCLEGVAAGPAIEARYGKKAYELTDNEEVWEMESYYLAQALVNYILIVSPEKIIMGGGVMKQTQLFPLIRKKVKEFLNGYIQKDELDSEDYIVPPSLGDNAGIVGCAMIGLKSLGK